MPKKKLTKAQVKNKLRLASNQIYDLLTDKLAYGDSFIPISQNKLLEINNTITRAASKMLK
jgi:hypothetical protein